MPLDTGARLGRFVIDARVGAGGMGEVYRARDTRLNRLVAIKVLSPHLSADPEGRRRFEREARTLASLSHPHICPVYDAGREGERDYLVMEFLEGETLARRLARAPLTIDEAIRYAIAIAEALAAAHAHGVVHRDLKPGNVMLTAAGVKLVDFGIARVQPASTGDVATTLTVEGAVVGTYAYMAPEQLEGATVDARADLFAFGSVVFEMLTGEPAFARSTPAATAAAVLQHRLPAASSVRAETPPLLDRLIALCLAKKPEERWASAHDAALLLRESTGEASTDVRLGAASRTGRLGWVMAAVAVAVASALAMRVYTPAPVEPVRRLSVLPPPGTAFALEEAPQISPDGSRLMFIAQDQSGINRLYVRPLDSADASVVDGSEGATLPFWAPDSRGFGFFANDGWLKVVEGGTGASRNLARAAPPRGASWGDNDDILFVPFPALGVHRVSLRGGQAVAVPIGPKEPMFRWFPQWLPGSGGRYLFHHYSVAATVAGSRIGVADVESGAVATVFDGAFGGLYAAPGHVLFRRQASLAAVTLDVKSLEASRTPVPLPIRVSQNPVTTQPPFSVSGTGVLAYFEATPTSQLTRVNRGGTRVADISAPATYGALCASRDGTRVAADGTDQGAFNLDIWKPEANGDVRRLTFHEAVDFYPVCSPDGAQVVFASLRNGPPDLFRIATNAPGTEQLLLDTGAAKLPLDWSADGRFLFYSSVTPKGEWDIWVLPVDKSREPSLVVDAPRDQRDAELSPDGRWLAYASNESGAFEVYVQPFPAPGAAQTPRWQVSRGGGVQPHWREDGRELFYLSGSHTLTAVDVRPQGTEFAIGGPKPLFSPRMASFERFASSQYAVSSKGDGFVINRPSDAAATQAITVILNWPSLLPH